MTQLWLFRGLSERHIKLCPFPIPHNQPLIGHSLWMIPQKSVFLDHLWWLKKFQVHPNPTRALKRQVNVGLGKKDFSLESSFHLYT